MGGMSNPASSADILAAMNEVEKQVLGQTYAGEPVNARLDRLETKGLLHSWSGEPTPQRGGRRRKFYGLRPAGLAAIRQAYHAFTAMADGLEGRLEAK